MRKHRSSLAGIVLIILALLLAGCTTQAVVEEIEEVRIGVLLPLSGQLSGFGEPALNAAELYFDEINGKGGVEGKPIKYLVEDTGGDPETAARLARKLIEQDRVQAILGPLTSGCSIAAGEVCQSSGVPMINIAATTRGITRNLIGSSPIVLRASSSSFTFIVPISAAKAEPLRLARTNAVINGPSSRNSVNTTRSATNICVPNFVMPIAA